MHPSLESNKREATSSASGFSSSACSGAGAPGPPASPDAALPAHSGDAGTGASHSSCGQTSEASGHFTIRLDDLAPPVRDLVTKLGIDAREIEGLSTPPPDSRWPSRPGYYIPDVLREVWDSLSADAKVSAYAVAHYSADVMGSVFDPG